MHAGTTEASWPRFQESECGQGALSHRNAIPLTSVVPGIPVWFCQSMVHSRPASRSLDGGPSDQMRYFSVAFSISFRIVGMSCFFLDRMSFST